jgi:hypothetical protein
MESATSPLIGRVRTWLPGVVLKYDKKKRQALVHANARIIETGPDGVDVETPIKDAYMPVSFFRAGGFMAASDVKPKDTGRIFYSCMPLDQWKQNGQEYAVRMGRYALGDASFDPNISDYGHIGVEIPDGTMIIGAENGPRLTYNLPGLSVQLTSANELVLAAQVRLIIKAPDIIIDGEMRKP